MEQIAIFEVLRRHVSMIIVLPIAAALVGYAFSFLLPTRYAASALVLVRPQQAIKIGTEKDKEFLNFPMGGASAVETAAKTYIEMVKSPAVVGEVVHELGLDKEKAQQQAGTGKLAWLLPVFLKPADLKKSIEGLITILKYGTVIEDDPYTKAVKEVSDGLSMEALLDTYTFNIKYTAKDPQQAADVANTTAKTLSKFVNELRLSEARYQADHLKTVLEQSRQQVDAARERLESYKQEHSVFLPATEYDFEAEGDLRTGSRTREGGSSLGRQPKHTLEYQSVGEARAPRSFDSGARSGASPAAGD